MDGLIQCATLLGTVVSASTGATIEKRFKVFESAKNALWGDMSQAEGAHARSINDPAIAERGAHSQADSR